MVLFPIIIYCGWLLRRNWRHDHLKKRRRVIIVCIYALISYSALFEFPWLVSWNIDIERGVLGISLLNDMMFAIAIIPRWGWMSLIVLRIYLLYFDHELGQFLTNQKWKILMDPSVVEKNWFVCNKHKYGNEKWMIKYEAILVLLYGMIYLTVHLIVALSTYNYRLLSIIHLGFTGFFALCCIAIGIKYWSKYPSFLDTLGIRTEIRQILYFWVTLVSLILITTIFDGFDIYTKDSELMMILSIDILYIFVYYSMIISPIKLYAQNNKDDGNQKRESLKLTISQSNTTNFRGERSWKYLINTKQGYESFVNFLQVGIFFFIFPQFYCFYCLPLHLYKIVAIHRKNLVLKIYCLSQNM